MWQASTVTGALREVLNISQNYFVRGGSDRYFFSLTELLEGKGHRVIPFTAQHSENQPTEWARYFPDAVDFQSPSAGDLLDFIYSRRARQALERLLAEPRPDIAHLQIYYGQLTTAILGPLRRAGIPIVQTLHEYKLVCPVYTLLREGQPCQDCDGKHFWKAVVNRCNRGSLSRSLLSATEAYVSQAMGAIAGVDRFICVSEFQRQKLIELGVDSDKLVTIHNFVDVTSIPVNQRRGEYLLYFGRIERLKGIFTLIEAAAPLTTVPLLIAGEGAARAEAEALVERRGLSHIRFVGSKHGKELQELIARSLCCVLPSEWFENCPMSVLESYAHSRPVIGADIGGIPELVEVGEDGWLFPAGDVGKLRERLAGIIADPDAALALGLAGRRKVERRFSRDWHYGRVMDVYSKLL
ncbi:MAG: glycosyltransferase family 4 protein [Gemmatimonadaceae bacterium]|nr:glycosyltransferase family 4 protein [Gloeobacterales cyanobacterium ES-bin-141]